MYIFGRIFLCSSVFGYLILEFHTILETHNCAEECVVMAIKCHLTWMAAMNVSFYICMKLKQLYHISHGQHNAPQSHRYRPTRICMDFALKGETREPFLSEKKEKIVWHLFIHSIIVSEKCDHTLFYNLRQNVIVMYFGNKISRAKLRSLMMLTTFKFNKIE